MTGAASADVAVAETLKRSLQTIAKFSEIDGLDAHGRSAAVRFE